MIDYDKILNAITSTSTAKTKKDIFEDEKFLVTQDIGNVIIGRFLPNMKDLPNSVFHYYHHGFKSKIDTSTGIFQLCPNTYGAKCPTCKASITGWKGTDKYAKDESVKIRRRENWIANFYVISDAKHPENNGTVKLLRFGRQIHDKYKLGTEGIDKEIYGPRVFRLDNEGCNFRIITKQNTDAENKDDIWPTYTDSGFLPSSKIEGMTDEKISKILDSVTDLKGLFEQKTFEQLKAELDQHFFSNDVQSIPTGNTSRPEKEDDLDYGTSPKTETKTEKQNVEAGSTSQSSDLTGDETLDAMLEELKR